MGFLDDYKIADYDSPEMAKAMAMLQMAGLIGKPLAPGENMGNRLVEAVGGGITSYNKRLQELQDKRIEELDAEAKRKYVELQTKKIAGEVKDKEQKDEYIGRIFGAGSPEELNEKQKLEYMVMTGMTPPGEVFTPKYKALIDGYEVPLTAAQLLQKEKAEAEMEYKKNKKTVRKRGYGQEGVYDYTGKVEETRPVPEKPASAGASGKAQINKDVDDIVDSVYNEAGMKKKHLTPEQMANRNEIRRNAQSKAQSGKSPKDAVQEAFDEFHAKRKPKALTGTPVNPKSNTKQEPQVIKTKNGVGKIVG